MHSKSRKCFRTSLSGLGWLILVLGGTLWACQVPVFRYALERWTPDQYELVITPGKGGLSSKESAALDFLEEKSNSMEVPLNLSLRVREEGENSGPAAAVSLFYPGRHPGIEIAPIWAGNLTMENARRLVDSPLRRELAKRILKGESSVWLVIESGNQQKDDEAVSILEQGAVAAVNVLEIPEGVVGKDEIAAGAEAPVDRENILQSDVPLKIEFSVIRVSRDNPDEALFLPMFLNIEDDLGEWAAEPMAFPVFGRGRILEPLIGKGINETNIVEHSGYLCGACSCEVKDQNPGIDLLMAVNWDLAMEGSQVIIDKVLPPLEGTAAILSAADSKAVAPSSADENVSEGASEGSSESASELADATDSAPSPFNRILLLIGGIVVLLGIGTAMIMKGKSS